MKILPQESLDYVNGKLDGMELALNIINRRDVNNHSVRWLVKEMQTLRDKINNMVEEE
jgi:formyltetrahydrofolate synthetase|tara:strand:- start:15 stop:188 length:174 start_codon:yes stop_codon:yes gene_type:complete